MEKFADMHFSYLVSLRALRKAASPFLYNYEIRMRKIIKDETVSVLMKRLLDSSISQSCEAVFSAFDESVMFQKEDMCIVTIVIVVPFA